MDFGRVAEAKLPTIDFALPPDHPDNALWHTKPADRFEVRVGCAKWGRPDWVGKIYPKGTKAADFLSLYAKQFDCIELNAAFYQLPPIAQIQRWYAQTPANFLFVPKFINTITHLKRLKNTKAEVDAFLSVMSELKEKLGPVFLMPHPQMGEKHFETIAGFIEELPREVELFMELRHEEWYEPPNADRIFGMMRQMGTGSIITDTAGFRNFVHMRLTTRSAFIRFVGNSLHPSDYSRIDDWVARIKQWRSQGLERVFFFMHQHDELYSPELCKYLIQKLNDEMDLGLQVPEFVGEQGLL